MTGFSSEHLSVILSHEDLGLIESLIVRALEERVEELHKSNQYLSLSKILRRQIETTIAILSKRNNINGRERVQLLKAELDGVI